MIFSFRNYSKIIFVFIFFIFSLNFISAQKRRKIDSLTQLVKTGKEDTNLIINLNRLCFELKDEDSAKAIAYGKKALLLSQSLKYSAGEANALNEIGTVYGVSADYDLALFYFKACLEISKAKNYSRVLSSSYNNIAIIYQARGNYDKAMDYYMESLALYEKKNDSLEISKALNNIGTVYFYTNQFDKATGYYERSIAYKLRIGDRKGLIGTRANLGIIYKDQKKYDKAMENFTNCLKESEELGYKRGIAKANENIASLYKALGDYDLSIRTYETVEKLFSQLGQKQDLVNAQHNLGALWFLKNNFIKAKTYYEKAISLSRSVGHVESLKESLNGYSETLYKLGEYKTAFEIHKEYSAVKDSIYNENNTKHLNEIESKYENEKKTLEIEKLEKGKQLQDVQLKQKGFQNMVFEIGLVFAAVIIFFILRVMRQRKKANAIILQQKAEVERKNEKIQLQKDLLEEKQKEILDSIYYARRIQQALITSKKYIGRNLNRLNKS